MERATPNEAKELLKKPWLNRKDIYAIYPVGRERARLMMNEAREKAIEENYFVPISRPPVVPTECVLELFPLKKPRNI